jgi:hypothetical protein
MNPKRVLFSGAGMLVVAAVALAFTMTAGASGKGAFGHTDEGAIGGDFGCATVTCPTSGWCSSCTSRRRRCSTTRT